MQEGPFTFGALWAHGNRAGGWAAIDSDSPCYRLADRMIQKARKAKQIELRKDRAWHPTTQQGKDA